MVYTIKRNILISKFVVVMLIANLLTINLFSQSTDFNNYSYKVDENYILSYWTATKKIATGPFHWKQKEWIIAGSVVAVGATLYIFDNEIRQVFQKNKNDNLDFVSKYVFEPWGSGLYPVALFGGYYIYGLAAKKDRAKQIALGGAQAFVMAAVSSQLLKHISHRHRPNQDCPNPYLWEGPFKGWDYTAFPSGHTTAAFAIASMMSKVYKDKLWIGILSYGLATGVGLSRVYDNVHWPTDVVIGAALGYAIGQTVYSIMAKDSKFSMGISHTGGIAIAYRIE